MGKKKRYFVILETLLLLFPVKTGFIKETAF